MTILNGKNSEKISGEKFRDMISGFEKISIDIGTGDGKNVYRKAKLNPDCFYIGVDPVKDNMTDISVKISKKPEKGGLSNVALVIASAENMPEELLGIADEITVLFPWGVLLEGVVKPVDIFIDSIRASAKQGARFEFITTYSGSCEENTIRTRALPELSVEYFEGEYSQILLSHGLKTECIEKLGNDFVKSFESKWAKQLAYGRKRDFFRLTGEFI